MTVEENHWRVVWSSLGKLNVGGVMKTSDDQYVEHIEGPRTGSDREGHRKARLGLDLGR